MPVIAESPVAAPDPTVPAAADPTTVILMWVRHMRRTHMKFAARLMVVFAVWTLFSNLFLSTVEFSYRSLLLPLLYLAAVAWLWSPLGVKPWENLPTDELQARPWRPVGARVLRGRRKMAVIEVLIGGEQVALDVRIDPAHLAMVTDAVWLVPVEGPWFMVRVPGSRELFSARRGKVVPVAEPAAVPVTERWARVLRDQLTSIAAQSAFGACLAAATGFVVFGFQVAAAASLAVVVIFLPALALGLRHRLPDFRLPTLVRAADWTRADAVLSPWRSRRDGTAAVTATLTLPDGTTRTATIPAATVDLLGAVFESSTLWVGGHTGRVAVGFPGYPHVAYADLS
ncbi:hypothetical protein JOD54_002850 [Actinokineospora baliensis]|uniref:hypothetical protein n=1 Tax=Actinokineospora baliensis TaxID=547056 RepID=UPI0019576A59|nr:hypothetical protein [Actinokineospora baliensis]MBM7772646.1 hypothetical protein [Actinokineospora baliensis]